jgi:hypothetical protein
MVNGIPWRFWHADKEHFRQSVGQRKLSLLRSPDSAQFAAQTIEAGHEAFLQLVSRPAVSLQLFPQGFPNEGPG